MEKDGGTIPPPIELTQISLEEKQIPLAVEVFMPPIRKRQANRFAKKERKEHQDELARRIKGYESGKTQMIDMTEEFE